MNYLFFGWLYTGGSGDLFRMVFFYFSSEGFHLEDLAQRSLLSLIGKFKASAGNSNDP